MERICAHTECGKPFNAKTHNQRYCSDECCRLATNKRIMERYYERKARRKGGRRICVSIGCQTVLNRYNDSETCALCDAQRVESVKATIFRDMGYEFSYKTG